MKIKAEFEVELPSIGAKVPIRQLDEWVEYNIGVTDWIAPDNPLIDYDLDVERAPMHWREI